MRSLPMFPILLEIVLVYGRRPWHIVFGHGECQVFLDVERQEGPAASFPVTSHVCCECNLPCKER